MLRPTFAGYQVAKRGLSVSQKLLDVTGQNITNINTDGYTRQRVDLYAIAYSSGTDKFAMYGGQIGRGVGDLGPSQIRDPFLDIRYRAEAAKVGREDVIGTALEDLEEIFGEISKKGLDSQFSNLISQLQALTATPSDPVIEGVVKTASSMITQLFNHYSKQLQTVREQQTTYLDDSVNVTNKLMSQIAELNNQIRSQNIHGDKALELNDRRNMLIDELSTYMNIEVKRSIEKIGSDREVEILSIVSKDLVDGAGDPLVLVAGKDFSEIDLVEPTAPDKDVQIILKNLLGTDLTPPMDITNELEKGQISGYVAFLNNKGEFTDDPDFTTKDRGIQYYEGMLNKLAGKFAEMFNDANRIKNYKYNADGTVQTDPVTKEPILGTPPYTVKKLFDYDPANAALTIKIHDDWRDNTKSYITNTTKPSIYNNTPGEGNYNWDSSSETFIPAVNGDWSKTDTSAANDNIFNLISQFNKKVKFTHEFGGTPPTDENFLFEGTLQEMFSYTSSTVDLQISNTKSLYDGYGQTLLAIDTNRQSISGVSLDEEGINLLTYNKSYAAAARLMTTLDEALDVLINRTGRVGL